MLDGDDRCLDYGGSHVGFRMFIMAVNVVPSLCLGQRNVKVAGWAGSVRQDHDQRQPSQLTEISFARSGYVPWETESLTPPVHSEA